MASVMRIDHMDQIGVRGKLSDAIGMGALPSLKKLTLKEATAAGQQAVKNAANNFL